MDGMDNHKQAASGLQSTHGSQGELSDRTGSPGFATGATSSVSGSATTEPDRSKAGFEVEKG